MHGSFCFDFRDILSSDQTTLLFIYFYYASQMSAEITDPVVFMYHVLILSSDYCILEYHLNCL